MKIEDEWNESDVQRRWLALCLCRAELAASAEEIPPPPYKKNPPNTFKCPAKNRTGHLPNRKRSAAMVT